MLGAPIAMADQISGLLSPFLRARRIAAVRPWLGDGPLLDYGCGIGELAAEVDAGRYLGVDVDAESLAVARRRHPAHRFLAVDELEAAAPVAFDRIVALALIEHLPDPRGWLAAMGRRLAAGGRIVLTTPEPRLQGAHDVGARFGLFSRAGAAEHQSLLDGRAMARLAAGAGLEVVARRRFLAGANQLFVLAAVEAG
jgi:SAM-dependent methyltransferase